MQPTQTPTCAGNPVECRGCTAARIAALAAIILLGLWLRFDQLGAESFWGDEFAYVYLDSQPPGDHHRYSHGFDAYIHLYGGAVHLIGGTLKDEMTMRLLPALLGTLAMPLIYLIGRQCGGTACGLIAALLLAIHPFAVDASRTATQYGHLLFGSTLLIALGLAVVRTPRWWHMIGLVLVSAYVVHLQVFFATLVLAIWLTWAGASALALLRRRGGSVRAAAMLVGGGLLLALLCLPEYLLYIRPSLGQGGRLNFAASAAPLWSKADWCYIASVLIARQPWQRVWCYALGMIGMVFMLWRRPALTVIFGLACGITVAMLHLICMQSNIGVPPRYISYLFPLFLMLMAAGVWTMARLVGALLMLVPTSVSALLRGTVLRRAKVS
jgi:hypothetical protein